MSALQIDPSRVIALSTLPHWRRASDEIMQRLQDVEAGRSRLPSLSGFDSDGIAMAERVRNDNGGGPGLGPPLSGCPWADNDVSHLRAEIKIGDKVVARIYNSGASEIAGGYGYLSIEAGFGGQQEGTTVGPDLGDMRIAALMKLIDSAQVAMAKTALTQAQWLAEKAKTPGSILSKEA